MATRVWQSADGDWNNVASWTGAAVPVNNDVAIFPENNSVSVTSNQDVQDAVDLDAIITQPGYTGDIGTGGAHLNISADRVLHEGSGTLFYKDGDGLTDLMIINSNGGGAVLSGTSITRVIALQGNITLDSALAALTNLEVSFFRSRASDVNITIENGAGAITNLFMNGGIISCSAAITNLFMQSGTFTQESTAGAITNLFQLGGLCTYKTNSTLALAQILAGILDCSKTVLSTAKLIISDLRVYPGAKAIVPTDLVTVTAGGELLERITLGDPT